MNGAFFIMGLNDLFGKEKRGSLRVKNALTLALSQILHGKRKL